MNLFVLLKMAPDTVEELNVGGDNKSLDAEFLRFKLGDWEEHALEQALLIKEKHGGTVTVLALEAPEVDDALFTALAKGADKAVKIPVEQAKLSTTATAQVYASYFKSGGAVVGPNTLILPGSQAIDDLEGELAPLLAEALQLPYIGVVSGVRIEEGGNRAVVIKEFSGGLRGEFEVGVPAVLGIQSAEKPPRYVPVAKVRAVMKTARIETPGVAEPEKPVSLELERMYKPEAGGRAQMIEGAAEEVVGKLVGILAERGIL